MGRGKRKKKKKQAKKRNFLQDLLLLLTGSALLLCVASVTYGYFARNTEPEHAPDGLRIEILNGSGEKGIAKKVARALRVKGVDVFRVDNADSFEYSETILIARSRREDLTEFGESLGCKNVMEQLQEESLVDATLIIGADIRELRLGDGESGLLE